MAGRLFDHALNEPGVESIALIDSPGGTVDGTQTLANKILAARGKKPITAFADWRQCVAQRIGLAHLRIRLCQSS